jgi:EAL domain-containing protein (putative c-di-GMP-specific phosphodiesterase class I)
VETAEQRAWLVSHGCWSLQGYLFSRPVAAETFLQLAQQAFQKHT